MWAYGPKPDPSCSDVKADTSVIDRTFTAKLSVGFLFNIDHFFYVKSTFTMNVFSSPDGLSYGPSASCVSVGNTANVSTTCQLTLMHSCLVTRID